ncbi:MAG: 5-formyltetrahydrofolate cyclo-ligase [Lachnospiraceae bacterium]|nr:5-formyltetrahydrofolate cyclo-ligase [Lachnospiraceae bacterium]
MSGEKDRIRAEYKRRRASIPASLRREKSAQIVEHLAKSSLFRDYEKILCYAPLPEETDIMGVRNLCYETKKHIAFPKTCGDDLLFYELHPGNTLVEGTFHVMEPAPPDDRRPVSWENALCLTPGVVFDRYGNRFGYGRGYYDRYFATHPQLTRCGIAFSEQISAERLPADKTDLPMQALLTEEGFIL